jgi:hypothetical protein
LFIIIALCTFFFRKRKRQRIRKKIDCILRGFSTRNILGEATTTTTPESGFLTTTTSAKEGGERERERECEICGE